MSCSNRTRRAFLKTSAGILAAGLGGPCLLRPTRVAAEVVYVETPLQTDLSKIDFSRSDRFRIGAIGLRHQGAVITENALPLGDVVAMCDVDRDEANQYLAREQRKGFEIVA